MVIDLLERVRSVGRLYGLSDDESEYLFEVMVLRLFDFDGYYGLDIGKRVMGGLSFFDFILKCKRDSGFIGRYMEYSRKAFRSHRVTHVDRVSIAEFRELVGGKRGTERGMFRSKSYDYYSDKYLMKGKNRVDILLGENLVKP